MSMQAGMDRSTLRWVRKELDETLGQATAALQRYSEVTDDRSQLQFCATHLHQVNGILQMLELHGAAMLTEEMEALGAALLDGCVVELDEALEALMRSILQLRSYLERLQGGQEDAPLLILPLVNDLRAAHGQAIIADSALFAPQLDGDDTEASGGEDRAGEVAARVLPGYQRGLLGYLRARGSQSGLERMRGALEAMQEAAPPGAVARCWWIAAGLVEAVATGEIDEHAAAVRHLLTRIERNLRQAAKESQSEMLSSALQRGALYYVARVNPASERLAALHEYYHLGRLLEDERRLEDVREGLFGAGAEAFGSVAAAIREDLTAIKEAIDLYVRGAVRDSSELSSVADSLERTADTLGVLGMAQPRRVVVEQAELLRRLVEEPSEDVAEDVERLAGSLLYVELSLADMGTRASGDSAVEDTETPEDAAFEGEAREVFAVAVHEAVAEMRVIKEALVHFLESGETAALGVLPERFASLAGALVVLQLGEAATILDGAARYIDDTLAGAEALPEEASLDALADVIAGIEYYLENLAEGHPQSSAILETAAQRLAELGYGAESAESPAVERASTDGAMADEALEQPADAPPPPAEPATAPVARARVDLDVDVRSAAMDDEILEIFVEEADEVLATLREVYPRWRESPEDEAALATTRRMFHTLKGSGRLAGALLLGELAWAIEDLLNRVLDGTQEPSPAMHAVIGDAIAAIPELIEELRTSTPPAMAVREIMGRAVALSAGRGEPGETHPPPESAAADGRAEGAPGAGDSEDDAAAAHARGDVAEEGKDAEDAPLTEDDEPLASPTAKPVDHEVDVEDEAGSAHRGADDDGLAIPHARGESAGDDAGAAVLDTEPMGAVAPMPPEDDEVSGRAGAGEAEPLAAETARRARQPLDRTLYQIFSNETADHLDVIEAYLGDCERTAGSRYVSPSVVRSLHTLSGSARMAGVTDVADLAAALERMGRLHQNRWSAPDGADLALLRRCVGAIREVVDALDGENPIAPALEPLTESVLAALPGAPTPNPEDDPPAGRPPHSANEPAAPDAATWSSQPAARGESPMPPPAMPDGGPVEVPEAESAPRDEPERAPPGANDGLPRCALTAADYPVACADPLFAGGDVQTPPVVAPAVPAHELAEPSGDDESDSPECPDTLAGDVQIPPVAVSLPDDEPAAIAAALDEPAAPSAGAESETVDDELAEVFLEEAQDLLGFIEETLGRWEESAEQDAQVADLHRSLHTLKGGARMAGFAGIGQFCHRLESLLADVASHRVAADDTFLDGFRESVAVLAELLQRAERGERGEPSAAMLAQVDALRGGAEPAAGTDDAGETDRELVEVFLQEAAELLAGSERALHDWRVEGEAAVQVEALQRNLHTLKGGARMAGFQAIADLAHALETLLKRVEQQEVTADAELLNLLELTNDRLIAQREAAEAGRDPVPATELVTALNTVERGEEAVLPVDEPAAAPGVEADDGPPPEPTPMHDTGAEAKQRADEVVRVRSGLLNDLVNYAGEVSIYRARLEQQAGEVGFNLGELEQTVSRLRDQLRTLEIDTEAQILYRVERSGGNDGAAALAPADRYAAEFDPLEMDRFTRMQELSRALAESVSDFTSIQGNLEHLNRANETLLLQQSRVNTDLQDGLMRTRMVPFANLVPRMRRVVRQASNELGKQATLRVLGAQGEMDRTVLDRVVPALEHMLRNAVAHGIEPPEARTAAGKAVAGSIDVSLAREGADVVIRVADDGSGMDLAAIRSKAVARGLMREDAPLSDREITRFVLESGFSTAETITQIAGRGVGMDVVHAEIKQLGGSLDIETNPGAGTGFTVRLPFTLALNQALLCRAADEVYALPLSSIEGVVRIDRAELDGLLAGGSGAVYEYAGVHYTVRRLAAVLGNETTGGMPAARRAPLVLVHAGDHRLALHVDGLMGSREIVVKSVGAQISTVPGILGATILADGRVVLILDVGALVRFGVEPGEREGIDADADEALDVAAPIEPERRAPRVMVVDDSITMRRVAARLLERNDYEVATAKDGVDAVALLQEQLPDVVLLDIEMPRMDGYELATHMRNDPLLRSIPIVMVTSRTGDKHRQRARELGVERYLGKPYQEGELLRTVAALIPGGSEHG